jgi:hypothetical protein
MSKTIIVTYVKIFMKCVRCDSRIVRKSLHLFDDIVLRLFVSARKDMSSSGFGFICNACGMRYIKWRNPNGEKAQLQYFGVPVEYH